MRIASSSTAPRPDEHGAERRERRSEHPEPSSHPIECRRDGFPATARAVPHEFGFVRAALLLVVERLRSGGRAFAADARHGQIAVLASLLVFGRFALDFDISLAQIAFTLGGALAFQWAATRLWRLPSFEPRSALISGLSLCLLLRTDAPWLALAAAAIAVFSKFLIRVRGKHLFNPTNLALVAMVLVTGGSWARPGAVWISPGQWGSTTVFAAVLGCAGITVAHRAARSDVAFAFLAGWLCVLFGRAAWLGQPWSVPVHQLESGALVLFTFFMISDPRTTPDARPMRIAFGLAAALLAGVIQFVLFRASGPVWALALLSPAVPLLDRLVPATRFEWTASFARTRSSHLGPLHETPAPAGSTAHDRALALARTHGRP